MPILDFDKDGKSPTLKRARIRRRTGTSERQFKEERSERRCDYLLLLLLLSVLAFSALRPSSPTLPEAESIKEGNFYLSSTSLISPDHSRLEKAVSRRIKVSRSLPQGIREGKRLSGSLGVFTATAYCPCAKCCGKWASGYTATGAKAQYGVIAVDPRVIKLGTKVHVQGYGDAIASDTGGAIKGRRIDVCFSSHSQALNWGRKTVKVWRR